MDVGVVRMGSARSPFANVIPARSLVGTPCSLRFDERHPLLKAVNASRRVDQVIADVVMDPVVEFDGFDPARLTALSAAVNGGTLCYSRHDQHPFTASALRQSCSEGLQSRCVGTTQC